jgi:hypothetical protein
MGARVSAAVVCVALALAGCATRARTAGQPAAAPPQAQQAPTGHAHPQVVDPVAGAALPGQPAGGAAGQSQVSVSGTGGPTAGRSLAQPVSDAEVRAELQASGIAASQDQATFVPGGLAIAPIGAPAAVQAVINAGNQIARLPYRFGGGHGTFEDTMYDCSGSLSFVLAAAGLLDTTMTSGELMQWGAPGPGKWITIFANPGHTFMYVAGLRFDTVALAQTGSRWSNRSATEREGFAVRHPPGL